jgi:bacillithiol system protein YtxJ
MIVPLGSPADLEEALQAPCAVLYKHSPRCGVCVAAEREVRHFAEGRPDVPVYWLDVVAERGLAHLVAARLGVRHESPQVIVLESGAVRLAAAHWEVRATDLDALMRPSGMPDGAAAR